MNTRKILEGFRSDIRPIEVVLTFLRAVARLKNEEDLPDQYDTATIVLDQEQQVLLAAEASSLLELPASERLRAIMGLLDHLDGRDEAEFWIRKEAADQLVDILGNAQSARFSCGSAMRPAFIFSQRAREQGRQPRVQFAARNPIEAHLVSYISMITELPISIEKASPFCRNSPSGFDAELMMPPLNATLNDPSEVSHGVLRFLGIDQTSKGRVNMENIAIADSLTNTTGRVVLCVSPVSLTRMVGIEASIREELVHSGRLRAEMRVGSGTIYRSTSIETGLLVLDASDSDLETVRFVDLADNQLAIGRERKLFDIREGVSWRALLRVDPEWGAGDGPGYIAEVPVRTLSSNGCVLAAERYVGHHRRDKIQAFLDRYERAQLAEFVELIRPVALKKADDGGTHIREAAPADIDERGYLVRPARDFSTDRAGMRKALKQQVRPGDVLLSIKGNVGIVGLVPECRGDADEDGIWTVGQSLMILRSKSRARLSPVALYEYLSADTVQEHLKSLGAGTTVKVLAMKDIQAFPVPLPAEDETAQIEADFFERQRIHAQIERLKAEVREMRTASWPNAQIGQPETS